MATNESAFRVMYVDDNRDIANSAVQLLKIVGFEAQACYDGPTALRIAENFRPSVCMLDLHMPGMDGDEVATRLRAEPWCPLVLIAVTAMSDESSRIKTKNAGFDSHLVKPVDPHKLLEVVDTLCRAVDKQRG